MNAVTTHPVAESSLSQAALMVLLLEEEVATSLLSALSAEELRALGKEMVALGEIESAKVSEAVAAFAREAAPRPLPNKVETDKVRTLFENALGGLKADSLLRDIEPEAPVLPKHAALELLKWLDLEAVLPLLQGEHPQVVTALLMQMKPETAAAALAALPDCLQADLVHRVATIKPISLDALAFLAELVEKRLSTTYGKLPIALGGLPQAAEIVNSTAKAVSKRVIPQLAKRDKALAKKLEEAMFRFEMLYALDAKAMGTLLRNVENDILIDALKGVEPTHHELFFCAMSSRAADGVRDEMEARGKLRRDQVETAQRSMIATARRLADEGELSLGADDDYV